MQEITLSFAELVTAFIIAMGIPSAVTGLIVWRLKKRIEDDEEIQDKKNWFSFWCKAPELQSLLERLRRGPYSGFLMPIAMVICTGLSIMQPA